VISIGFYLEILDLRHFGSADLRGLLEEESERWLSLLSWDYRGSAEMILRYIDAKILPGYAAIERGRVLGYCFFVYEGAKGVIGDVFVESASGDRRREIENELLIHVIDTLQQSPGIHRIEAQLLLHESGTATESFMDGFRRFPRLFLTMPIGAGHWVEQPLPAEFELRTWQEQDYQPAAGVIASAYRAHVDSDINDQYRNMTGSLRFLNNIVRFPGCGVFDPTSSFSVTHRSSRALVGLLLCSKVRENVGHITQVCVLPEYRNRQLGEHLIRACYDALANSGAEQLTLTVTEANSRAVALYKRLGFQQHTIFDAFVWEG
jgi:ribosomal protein S18 acetylase RimI-like enzyme